jgi:hypothetical protein
MQRENHCRSVRRKYAERKGSPSLLLLIGAGKLKVTEKDENIVKKLCLTLSLMLTASAFAQSNTTVRWRQIIGNITPPGGDNPVATVTDANGNTTSIIHSGTLPWTTRLGDARVNLSTGEGSFEVAGLVLNGGNATGTTGGLTSVVGTLVCNPGTAGQAILDTNAVDLSAVGDAELSFKLSVPANCNAPLFLIRAPQAGLRWIATGAILVINNS